MSEFDPIDYAEQACRDAGLTKAQIHDVHAYLVGVFSSYVDPDAPPLKMTPARWRRYVHAAIGDVTP